MLYLENNALEFRFPELHVNAGVKIDFQRTLRLPDDGEVHYLPPGFGSFPLRHIDDFDLGQSNHLKKRGGVIMPMFQADALWLNFETLNVTGEADYPIAIKIGTGKVCAISGDAWTSNLNRSPQDYIVIPDQPWVDGYNVGRNKVKQFVAAPLGKGYTVEEQITNDASNGGIQIQVFPMKREFYDQLNKRSHSNFDHMDEMVLCCLEPQLDMGLAAGGEMRQEIYDDPHAFEAWDQRNTRRCFVTIANAEQWISMTGEEPPMQTISASEYTKAGLPWYDYYDADRAVIEGAKKLSNIKSVNELTQKNDGNVWQMDPLGKPANVVNLGRRAVSGGEW